MADKKIKTKDVVKGTIKQIDKAAVAGDRMRTAYIQTKEKAEQAFYAEEASPEEYASGKMSSGGERVASEAAHQFDRLGRKGVRDTKENAQKAKQGIQQFKDKQAAKRTVNKSEAPYHRSSPSARQTASDAGRQGSRIVEQTGKTVKQSAKSAGKKTIKTVKKGSSKTAAKTVKTAERTAKTTIKTAEQSVKAAQKAAKASAKAAQRAVQVAKATAKAVAKGVKLTIKATIATIKAIIAATKALISAIIAGGWVAVVIIIVICLIALLFGSVFGIFFSGEDTGTGMSMPSVVQEINTQYNDRITEIQNAVSYDSLEMSGSRAVWKDVLAVYAVKTNMNEDNAQEVASMDESKKQLLSDIFWEMNSISSRTEEVTETEITETDDGNGNIVQTETTVTKTYLYITVSHKTVEEMAKQYGFNDEQKEYLTQLLADENSSLWAEVLYGIHYSDDAIVTVALSQVGNVGGEPYWSWYGFGSRVEWCACFVSWCANECGYIDSGIIPKYAGCSVGMDWFKSRGQWADGDDEPVAGMIIFFDWDGDDGQDGNPDHTGIVEKVENGIVYTIEGNTSDSCRERSYPVGYYEILGYGIPQY